MREGRRHSWIRLQAAVFVGAARVLLVRRKPSVVLRLLVGGPSGPSRSAGTDVDAALDAVRRAGRVLRADCLPQSIALTALLHRSGSEPALILGCRRYGVNDWGAHAWVEVDGHVLDPVEQPHHAQLARLEAAQNWEVGPAPR